VVAPRVMFVVEDSVQCGEGGAREHSRVHSCACIDRLRGGMARYSRLWYVGWAVTR